MLKIGVTGGIGSGKTTICKIFESLGIPVFYADNVAKEVMIKDQILKNEIIEYFGRENYTKDGILNRKHLANIVFNNDIKLKKLNALVHPAVFRAFDIWVNQLNKNIPYCLKEAALLFESGSFRMCNKNILVTAPLELKIARVMQRDKATKEDVVARMKQQMNDEQKEKLADYIVTNDEQKSIIEQVFSLHQEFLKLQKDAD